MKPLVISGVPFQLDSVDITYKRDSMNDSTISIYYLGENKSIINTLDIKANELLMGEEDILLNKNIIGNYYSDGKIIEIQWGDF